MVSNVHSFDDYLKPTCLCDFDRNSQLRERALRLAENQLGKQQTFSAVAHFVKELPYRLENWDVRASETLGKGWGMCSGKANLLVAMLRSLKVPARYRVYKIKPEQELWNWIAKQHERLASQLGDAPLEQDHVEAEVYLDSWKVCDLSRDSAFEEGLKRLGIPLERKPVTNADGSPSLIILASIDQWALARQRARRFKRNRQSIFSRVNEQLDKIRRFGGG